MCTAVTYKTKDFYLGRTLDYEFSYGDEVTVTPRNYPFNFRHMGTMKTHYAIIGMAYISDNYPLYYDAANEKGLCIAGLNFVGNADYKEKTPDKDNIAQFELIPWLLGQCASVQEAKAFLEKINLVNTPFSNALPLAQLHWLIADSNEAITVESVKEGIKIYQNPVGVLTNNPPFDKQIFQLNNYIHLSRFVRAAFVKMNSVSEASEAESVSQVFHIMGSVEQQRGCCDVGEGKFEITIYTACCNADKGIYYYTTYNNHQITAIDMHKENLDGVNLIHYPLIQGEQIKMQN